MRRTEQHGPAPSACSGGSPNPAQEVGVTRVSHGGHAFHATPEGPDQVGDVFVAGIDAFGMLVERPDNPAGA
jgi:hypothetical protein